MFGLDAGTLEQKGQLLEAFFGAMGSKARKWMSRRDVPTSRHPHVATSQRRDVRSTMQKSTIRKVVTFQRRDVSTSRRRNVTTSQRRDVSTGSALHHLKHEWFGKRGGIGRRTNEGTEFQSRVTQTSKKCP